MKRMIAVGIAALFAGLPISASAASLADYVGNWKVAKVVGFGEVSSGEKEAEKGLGQPVVISTTSIQMPSGACNNHPVTFKVADVNEILGESWEIRRSDLNLSSHHLGKRAGYIDATCADALVLDKNDLLMPSGDGAFYIVERGS